MSDFHNDGTIEDVLEGDIVAYRKIFNKEADGLADAKREIERLDGNSKRKWLEYSLDSYENPENRVSVYVLEGSPPVGIILYNKQMGCIRGFDLWADEVVFILIAEGYHE